jgi:hypothetical protein
MQNSIQFTKCKVLSKYDMNSDHLPVYVKFYFKKTKINRCDIKNANDLNIGKLGLGKI